MPSKEYLEVKDTVKLESAATCLRDKLMIRLLRRFGCRVGEVLGIEVDDIDFDAGTIAIEHKKIRLTLKCPDCGGRLSKNSVFCGKCGNKVAKAVSDATEVRRMRTLPVDPETLALVKEYIDRGGPVEIDGHKKLLT